MNYKLKKISGDASFREFYRIKKNNKSSIIVFARKERHKNLTVYGLVNLILNKNGISAPKLIKSFLKNNMIEITDLGDTSFFEFIKNKKNKVKYYKHLVDLIIKLQKVRLKKNYSFLKKKITFNKYNSNLLHRESDLFFDWYLKYSLKIKNVKKIKKILKHELNLIYKKLYFKNKYFTHRDFHGSNIMIFNKKFNLIDSQDAILGNPLYDLASLIDDVRIKLSKKTQDALFEYYYKNSSLKLFNRIDLRNDFDILSIQRCLKILGIFVRLHKRDRKSKYLKYLPHTWNLIERRMKNPIFVNLEKKMREHLPLKKLKKINKL